MFERWCPSSEQKNIGLSISLPGYFLPMQPVKTCQLKFCGLHRLWMIKLVIGFCFSAFAQYMYILIKNYIFAHNFCNSMVLLFIVKLTGFILLEKWLCLARSVRRDRDLNSGKTLSMLSRQYLICENEIWFECLVLNLARYFALNVATHPQHSIVSY